MECKPTLHAFTMLQEKSGLKQAEAIKLSNNFLDFFCSSASLPSDRGKPINRCLTMLGYLTDISESGSSTLINASIVQFVDRTLSSEYLPTSMHAS